MYLLALTLLLSQPVSQKGRPSPPPAPEIPALSTTNSAASAEYTRFLHRLFLQGMKANPQLDQDYAADIARIARAYLHLSVTWDGMARLEDVKAKGFVESKVLILLPMQAFIEVDGKLSPILLDHNSWSKKIRPNTRITIKAFVEDIRYHNGEYAVVLSKVTLVDRKP